MKIFTLLLFAMLTLVGSANAEEVNFFLTNNGNGSDLFDFEETTGTFDHPSGLTAMFTAVVDGNTGELNAAGNSFGVNAENGVIPGNPNDEASQLDGDQGDESIEIMFSGPVSATLTSVGVTSFGSGSDTGTIDIGGVSTAVDSGTSSLIPTHTELVGNTLTISHTGGNGFSLDSLTFHVKAVPEPSSLLVLGAVAGLGLCSRRRS